ncbi:upstream stimulatory factor 2-like isoform X2 [Acanthaster planci]|uniref:Upstream stimulatory factor 2-like isoform X2 n=1 Tax=Acanthaster planci TaxID=133434 RepID=A0A8B8A0J7_ACAPL|nr:upstream stimulatory factor 2-like isoform X2 [Acanthaster planci]
MDMLEQALEPSGQEKSDQELQGKDDGEIGSGSEDTTVIASSTPFGTENIHYQFRTDSNGQSQVTYRVVQVDPDATNSTSAVNVVTTTSFPQGGQAVTQVIQSPFSNGESPTSDAPAGETRFTYFPTSAVVTDPSIITQQAEASLANASASGGQFYVMMSPQDVLQGAAQRTIAPRTHTFTPKIDGARTARDDRRRATHNEVERRRRDKINNWIVKLSKLVPECAADQGKSQSKGGILSKTCDYIIDLRTSNARMAETVKEHERISVDNELLRQQVEELKNENTLLRAQLQQHGIEIVSATMDNS